MSSRTAAERSEIAGTIRRQIGPAILMSVGAHDFVATDDGLQFKIGGRQRWMEVDLNSRDTYDIRVIHITSGRQRSERVTESSVHDVYAGDTLREVVRRLADRGQSRRRPATAEQREDEIRRGVGVTESRAESERRRQAERLHQQLQERWNNSRAGVAMYRRKGARTNDRALRRRGLR